MQIKIFKKNSLIFFSSFLFHRREIFINTKFSSGKIRTFIRSIRKNRKKSLSDFDRDDDKSLMILK